MTPSPLHQTPRTPLPRTNWNFPKAASPLLGLVLFVLFVLSVSGCAGESVSVYVTPGANLRAKRTVAIMPLANLTTHPSAGQIISDLLYTELRTVQSFRLLENTEVWNRMAGKDQDIEDAALTQRARQLGQDLLVDAVLFGAVTEFRYKRGLDEEPAVGITLRLMDVASGQVLWVATISRVGGCDLFCKDSLSRSAQTICRQMAADIEAAIRKEPTAAPPAKETAAPRPQSSGSTPINGGPGASVAGKPLAN
ncbi:hypothetical protein NNJEOMEG_02988 [Fundidesulfovibrio magnetotacticus]|uniref:Lipoprotein n=1 Tax=Fundidesulfovibrio magnetotacticus TaxID=2730080 RepID=A0A6V8LW50_9BACT|nr:CsgG/HfaB family protein [Fundidesulfovibrio magnetotacticus]GFK95130.1 hypothetical protein NNJEOMEG_02988 [Fundidesulfovibrio magnetotacticus]